MSGGIVAGRQGWPGRWIFNMNIIICGAGEVGRHAAEVLGAAGHNVTIIDQSPAKLAALEEVMDVRNLLGNAVHVNTLLEAGCDGADLFIAATNVDEVNLLSASIASGVGAERTIARVHHGAFMEQGDFHYASHLGIDYMVCPEQTTAAAIAQSLRSPGSVAVESFAKGRIELQQIVVTTDSETVGRQLMELLMPASTRLAMIERAGKTFVPDGTSVIHGGDIVTLIGDVAGIGKARRMFHTTDDKRKYVIIVGGTSMGVWLCRALNSKEFSVRLIEQDQRRAEELAAKLEWVTVLRGDPTGEDVYNDERLDQCDAFVTLTDDDENNILLAARAKSEGVKLVIAVQQRSTYLHLLSHVGVDRAFSPRSTAVTQILSLLESGPFRKLTKLSQGVADVFEIRVPAQSNGVTGKPLKDVKFLTGGMVAAIQRGPNVFVPGGMDSVNPGDSLIIIAPDGAERDLRRVFGVR